MSLYIPESNGYYVLQQLEMECSDPSEVLTGWSDSFINMPENILFLDENKVEETFEYLHYSERKRSILRPVLETIRSNRYLKAYVWHLYHRLVTPSFSYGCSPRGFYGFPLPEKLLGKYASCVYVAAAFGAVSDARKKYESSGVPEDIARDTLAVAFGSLAQDASYAEDFKGMSPAVFSWLRLYVSGRLIQLGRFNFKLMEANSFGVVLQNKSDRRKIMLAEDGKRCNSKGYYLREKDPFGKEYSDPFAEGGFTAELEITREGWRGNVVDPRGFIMKETHFFSAEEWDVLIQKGDTLIDMHIPSGGGMTPEICKESFRQARDYFRKKYPGKFKEAIICHSWIFNNQFEETMPQSNLVKQLKECYLFPHESCGQDGFYFIFGRYYKPEEMDSAPRDNSLRRTMLEMAQTEEQLRNSGMIYFLEDLDRYGQSVYRNEFRLP